jgi:hypothetical protein
MFIQKTDIRVDLAALRKSIAEDSPKWDLRKGRICINSPDPAQEFNSIGRELIYQEFKYVSTPFKNTVWEDTLNLIPGKKTRARIMMMPWHSVLSMHRDIERRYHIAINTDPACIFYNYEEQKGYHIPADGYLYLVDTKQIHTFMNCTKTLTRTHLVVGEYV